MAHFTIELYKALELDPTIESEILADYPLWDDAHRPALNRKIIEHFWNREIGQETLSMFRLALKRKLNEIMPLYNQQYEISAIKFNQLETVKITNANTATGATTTTAESSNTSTAGAKSRAVSQELPQTMLSGNGDYATSAQDNVSDTTSNGSATDNTTVAQDNTGTNTTTGFQGNPALMLLQYRQSLVNVDMMIIDELEGLFMLVWGNGDNLTNTTPFGPFYPFHYPIY